MKRAIYVVNAMVIDANGTYNNVSGYPATFDSHTLNDDVDKAEARAYASFFSACSAGETAKSNGRPLTVVTLTNVNNGMLTESRRIGEMPELPDPAVNEGGEE